MRTNLLKWGASALLLGAATLAATALVPAPPQPLLADDPEGQPVTILWDYSNSTKETYTNSYTITPEGSVTTSFDAANSLPLYDINSRTYLKDNSSVTYARFTFSKHDAENLGKEKGGYVAYKIKPTGKFTLKNISYIVGVDNWGDCEYCCDIIADAKTYTITSGSIPRIEKTKESENVASDYFFSFPISNIPETSSEIEVRIYLWAKKANTNEKRLAINNLKIEGIQVESTDAKPADIAWEGEKEVKCKVNEDVKNLPTLKNDNNYHVTYTSSDTSLATVDEEGNVIVTNDHYGDVTITASVEGDNVSYLSNSVSYTINISADKADIAWDCNGDYTFLVGTEIPEAPKFLNNGNYPGVSFSSSNENLAKVDENGNITILDNEKLDSATITASIDGDGRTYLANTITCRIVVGQYPVAFGVANDINHGTSILGNVGGSESIKVKNVTYPAYKLNTSNAGNGIVLNYPGGFKAGDVITYKAAVSDGNAPDVYARLLGHNGAVIYNPTEKLNDVKKDTSLDFSEYTYTLTEDQESLMIARNGGKGAFVAYIQVERPGAIEYDYSDVYEWYVKDGKDVFSPADGILKANYKHTIQDTAKSPVTTTYSSNFTAENFSPANVNTSKGLKCEGDTRIFFANLQNADVTIVQAKSFNEGSTVKFDGVELDKDEATIDEANNTIIYKIENVSKGVHYIMKGDGAQPMLVYVGVAYLKDSNIEHNPITLTPDHEKGTVNFGNIAEGKTVYFKVDTNDALVEAPATLNINHPDFYKEGAAVFKPGTVHHIHAYIDNEYVGSTHILTQPTFAYSDKIGADGKKCGLYLKFNRQHKDAVTIMYKLTSKDGDNETTPDASERPRRVAASTDLASTIEAYKAENYLVYDEDEPIEPEGQDLQYVALATDPDGNVLTSTLASDIETGISEVLGEDFSEAVVYDLNGRVVSGELTPGIYIVRQGKKAVKVVIK